MLRTDFSDEVAWKQVCVAILEPDPEFGFTANLELVSDPEFAGLTLELLASIVGKSATPSFVFLVDQTALSHAEHPILVVDLVHEPGRTFRVIPSEMWAAENNVSIANMSFAEFADAAGADGVFRGFA